MERCGIVQVPQAAKSKAEKPAHTQFSRQAKNAEPKWNKEAALSILDSLLRPEQEPSNISVDLRKQKKKKRTL
jgi:hypothetical protein